MEIDKGWDLSFDMDPTAYFKADRVQKVLMSLTLFIHDSGKQVFWQTVKTEDPDEIPHKGHFIKVCTVY